MVMLKSLFLAAGLMFALGEASSKPAMATLQVQPNFDFSLTRKEFRVHYSGLGEDFTHESGDQVTIKIYNPQGDVFHTYDVDSQMKNTKKAYYFALNDAVDGEYKVEVCSGTKCSGKTPALTNITSGQIELSCENGRKDSDGWKTTGKINLIFNGPDSQDWITPEEYTPFENNLNDLLGQFKLPKNFKTDYNKHSLTENPTYDQQKEVLYAAIKYNVAQYRELFDKHRGDRESRTEYAHDKCKRKYLLSAHVHLVDTKTKEVKYRFKTTLHLSGVGKQHFILDEAATTENRKVYVEMTHENVKLDEGSYKVHVIFCATEKDAIESTYCADPVIHSKAIEVSQTSK